jgi:small subunit ribosomal protein S4
MIYFSQSSSQYISFHCKPQYIITMKDNQTSKQWFQLYWAKLPKHLTSDSFHYKELVNKIIFSIWIGLKINEFLLVEYYSRQTWTYRI